MSVIQKCNDTTDALDLFRPQGLYLKPIARLNVSVQLPQLRKSGSKISNWEVMERVKDMAKPFSFIVLKVAKSSLEFIRFEAEIDNISNMEQVLAKLDLKTIKLSGFQELLKIRAAEAKQPFLTRHDWDSFFQDNKSMNEMKPGERPDTIHVQNLPTKWFINLQDKSGISLDKPSELVVQRVFGTFGQVRAVDIPCLDPYRHKIKCSLSGIQTFSFNQDLVFDAYIQFKEYIGFVKAMNSLKGMKLLYKDRCEEKAWVSNIKVDFDRTKHLAESTIKKRAQERAKLINEERIKEEGEKRMQHLKELKEAEERRQQEEEHRQQQVAIQLERDAKRRRQMQREERRRRRKLKQPSPQEDDMSLKIAIEERKLLVAQRKLESIRLLDELLDRIKNVQRRAEAVSSARSKGLVSRGKDDLVPTPKQKTIRGESDRLRKKRPHGADGDSDIEDHAAKGHSRKVVADNQSGSELSIRLTSTEEELTSSGEDSVEKGPKHQPDGDEQVSRAVIIHRSRHKSRATKKKCPSNDKEVTAKSKRRGEEHLPRKKDLEDQILLAKRISSREERPSTSDTATNQKQLQRPERTSDNQGYLPLSQRLRHEKCQRIYEQKLVDRAKEELYDQMMNPHLYSGQPRIQSSSGERRVVKKGEHYEQVQKEFLESEIRAREREYLHRHQRSASHHKRRHQTNHSSQRYEESTRQSHHSFRR